MCNVGFQRALWKHHRACVSILDALYIEAIADFQHFAFGSTPRSRLANQLDSGVKRAEPRGNSSVLLGHERSAANVGLTSGLESSEESKHVAILFQRQRRFNPPRPDAGITP